MEFEAASAAKIRPAAVAGRFYPSDPLELRQLIDHLLANVAKSDEPAPKALIVPHAGYMFSGPIAASAYARLVPEREMIKRIVLLGPSHFIEFGGLASSSAEFFATPLGRVPVDVDVVGQLRALPQVHIQDEAHEFEHALEVQLPFLQVVLAEFKLVPLAVGEASPEAIAEVLEALWDGPPTRFVVSSDLSHYLSWEQAQRLDSATAQCIEKLDFESIGEDQACGRLPIGGLLKAAAAHALQPRTLDLRSSGDTAGPRHQVVGYGAFGFFERRDKSS